jgi:hypothetical protein
MSASRQRVKDAVCNFERVHGRSLEMRRVANELILQGGSSNTNNRNARRVHQMDSFYSGPALRAAVQSIVKRKKNKMLKIIDPCAGKKDLTPNGAFAADINPVAKGVKKVDFLKSKLSDYGVGHQKGRLMFVINPPFLIRLKGKAIDGWKLFLNKAADLCHGMEGS